MSVIRTKQQSEFSILSNHVLQDPNLSIEAIGLWAHCMSRPEDWIFYVCQLCAHFKIGKQKINKLMNELVANGYAFRGQKMEIQEKGLAGKRKVFGPIEYIFYPCKISQEERDRLKKEYPGTKIQKKFPLFQNRITENRLTENGPLQRTEGLQNTDAHKEPPNPQRGDAPKGAECEILAFGKFVTIEKQAHQKLCEDHGFEAISSLIDEINDYLASTGKKPYKDYAAAIRQWLRRRKQQSPKPVTSTPQAPKLTVSQEANWNENKALVDELKVEHPDVAAGLNWFYKYHVLKDKNDPGFDVSGLISHADFCRVLGKHLGLRIYEAKFLNGQRG